MPERPDARAGQALHAFERLTFVSRQPTTAGLGGEHRSRARAPSTDFVDHRPYQSGDDFRRVDWNVYGRLGSLHVKITEAQERLDLLLVLDCSASMQWGQPDKLDFARRAASALAYVGLGRSEVLRLACVAERGMRVLGPIKGRARYPEVVRFLDDVQPGGRVDLSADIAELARLVNPRGRRGATLVVLVSDLLAAEGVDAGLDALLRAGADVVVLHLVSPQELTPDVHGEVELVDAETGDTFEAALSVEVVARYRERFDAWLREVEERCRAQGLRYVRARTDRPLEALVLEDLRRAQVLR